MYKYILILFWICLISISVYAQPINNLVGDVVLPSPEAASFGKFGETPVSPSSGIADISVPIYNLSQNGISLPISLRYEASGFRPAEIPSWVGLGWHLNAGGMVSRVVQGRRDDAPNGYYHVGATNDYNDHNDIYELATGQLDGEPDIFSYSLPGTGYAGKFYFNEEKEAVFVPQADLKLELDLNGLSFNNFTIITPTGVRYIFGNTPNGSNQIETTTSNDSDQISTGFYLVQIASSDRRHTIDFKYSAYSYEYDQKQSCVEYHYYNLNACSGIPSAGQVNNCVALGTFANDIEGGILDTISTENVNIIFEHNTDREDIYLNEGKLLDAMRIETGQFCQSVDFSYDYFGNSTSELEKRLKLESVEFLGCTDPSEDNKYEFSYYNENDNCVSRFTNQIDSWGYYNGAAGNENNFPNIPPTTLTSGGITMATVGSSNRDPSETHMKYFNLQKITYPTDGTSTYEYEVNKVGGSYAQPPALSISQETCPTKDNTCCTTLTNTFTHTFSSQDDITFGQFDLSLITVDDCLNPDENEISVTITVIEPTESEIIGTYDIITEANEPEVTESHCFAVLSTSLSPGVQYTFKLTTELADGVFKIYDAPTYANSKDVGGLRTKKITDANQIGTVYNIEREFTYDLGMLLSEPTYGYVGQGLYASNQGTDGNITLFTYTENPSAPLSTFEGFHIAYPRVEETVDGAGTKVYEHFVENTINNNSKYPDIPRQLEIKTGKLSVMDNQDGQSNSISKTVNFPKNNRYTKSSDAWKYVPIKTFESCPGIFGETISIYAARSYNIRTNAYQMDSTQQTIDNVVINKSYTYDAQDEHLFPVEESITNSDGVTYTTTYDYATSYSAGNVKTMLDSLNMISPPWKTEQYADNTLYNGSRTTFDIFDETSGQPGGTTGFLIKPLQIENFEKPTSGLGSWVVNADVNSYDVVSGNPSEVVIEGWNPLNYVYTSTGKVSVKEFGNFKWSYDYYDNTDLLQTFTNIDSIKNEYDYDNLYRIKQLKNRVNTIATQETNITYQYGASSLININTDLTEYTVETEKIYDGLGRTYRTVQKDHGTDGVGDATTTIAYDNAGRVLTTNDPLNLVVTHTYFDDPLSRIESTTNNSQLGAMTYGYGSGTTPETNISNVFRQEVMDQDNRVSIVYKDIIGQTLAQSTGVSSNLANTITEYDEKSRVTKIHPPDGYNVTGLVYEYSYDGDDNITTQIIPDLGLITHEYDDRNLNTAMQNPEIDAQQGWYITQYDDYGRATNAGFGSNATNLSEILIQHFYDDHDDHNSIGTSDPQFIGRAHKKIVNVLDGFSKGNIDITTTYDYDNAGRLIEENTPSNHIQTISKVVYNYDGGDNLLTCDKELNGVEILSTNTYDPEGRLLTTNFDVDGSSALITDITGYSLRDELLSKTIGGLEDCSFDYNLLGWLTDINKNDNPSGSSLIDACPPIGNADMTDRLFSMSLGYNTTNAPQSAGNITQQTWKVYDRTQMTATYLYDHLNRITSSSTTDDLYDTRYKYNDARGNIKSIKRKGLVSNGTCYDTMTIDTLTFTYPTGSNQFTSITDAAEDDCVDYYHVGNVVTQSGIWAAEIELSSDADVMGNTQTTMQANERVILEAGFKFSSDGTSTFLAHIDDCASADPNMAMGESAGAGFTGNGGTYLYDDNGNMSEDPNKGFTFEYNHLNLPYLAQQDANNKIEWLYTAEGEKLKRTTTIDTLPNPIVKDYLGEVEFVDTQLDAVYHAEGRVAVVNGNKEFQYYLKDHLGNTRVIFKEAGGEKEILQESHYYPFGMEMTGPWVDALDSKNDYLYNGKELNKDLGLGLSDFGFRFYDPSIARFTGVDPISDKFPHVSTYNYAENEPVAHIDLWGLQKAKPQQGAQNLVVSTLGFNRNAGNPKVGQTQAQSVGKSGLGAISHAFSGTENQVVNYRSSLNNNTVNDISGTVTDFKAANPDGKVILVGHSAGADNTINAANDLGDVQVDLMITLDIADLGNFDDNVGSNVANAVNIFQRNDLPFGADTENNSSGNSTVQNFKALHSTHTSIDNEFVGTIIQMISNITGVSPNSTPKVNSHEEVKKQ